MKLILNRKILFKLHAYFKTNVYNLLNLIVNNINLIKLYTRLK